MRNFKKWSMMLVSILLVFQLTMGLSEAKDTEQYSGREHRNTVHTLVKGSPIHGSNGIAFDSKGFLYIGSVWGDEIIVMDPNSGRIVKRLGQAAGVGGADDLVFGPDGSLYWTALVTGEVGKLAPDGKTVSIIATGIPGANAIALSKDGKHLYVSLDFLGEGLYEVDITGTNKTPHRILTFPEYGVPHVPGQMNAMAFGPDGFLYGPLMNKGRVVKVNVTTGEVIDVATGFPQPIAVKFDAQGRMYVVDDTLGQIIRINLQNYKREVLATPDGGVDNLAFDAHGRLYSSDGDSGSINEVLRNGRLREVSPAGMIAPGGVAVLPGREGHDRVFVADIWSLRQFDGQTGMPKPLGKFNRAVQPMTVSAFGDKVILSSVVGNSVQVFDPVSGQVTKGYYDFAAPLNAIQFKGDLIVAELGTGSVVRQSATERTTLLQVPSVPTGLAGNDKDLFVADYFSGMVFQVAIGGNILPQPFPVMDTKLNKPVSLNMPEGMALEADGHLLVVEAGAGRLSRLDPKTGTITMVADKLELGMAIKGFIPTSYFNGVAIGPSGTIYVTGDKANVLYRIGPDDSYC